MILGIITNRMMDDFRKYDEIKAKRAEGGKLGGRPKKPQGLEENLKGIIERGEKRPHSYPLEGGRNFFYLRKDAAMPQG